MKQLREHIKKEIKSLMEAKYPAPPEIMNTLRNTLRLRPVIRYVNALKAVNSVPPSYRVFLHNGQFFDLYIEESSLVAKIGAKSYWLMNNDETAEAIKALNRVLTQPIPVKQGDEEETDIGDTGGAVEPAAEEEPEAEEEPAT